MRPSASPRLARCFRRAAGSTVRPRPTRVPVTQLRPIEEAQKMRDVILKDYPGKVTM